MSTTARRVGSPSVPAGPLPLPGPIALRAVEEAGFYVGVTERDGPNRAWQLDIWNRAIVKTVGAPYCQVFLAFRLWDAAKDVGTEVPDWLPQSGYAPTCANAFKAQGLWIPAREATAENVKRGDWLYFYKPLLRRIGHVEVVTAVAGDGVKTIGANTTGGSSQERDGGGIWNKSHAFSKLNDRSGFGRLNF